MRPLARLRRVGLTAVAARLARQIRSETAYLELVADLAQIPELPDQAGRTQMDATAADGFGGFEAELAELSGDEYIAVVNLQLYCNASMQGLHVAWSDLGQPMYAQWALGAEERETMPRLLSSIYPYPKEDEVLIEGAYTFRSFRRRGLMTSGMHGLLSLCRARGAARAVTLVLADNVPALRACAACGFVPVAVRLRRRRLGYRTFDRRPLTTRWSTAWEAATGPRG